MTRDLRLPVAPPGRNCGAPWHLGALGSLRCIYARGHNDRCSWYDQAAAACDRSDGALDCQLVQLEGALNSFIDLVKKLHPNEPWDVETFRARAAGSEH